MKIKKSLLFILVLSAGIYLRIFNLSKYSFWFDEAFSILASKEITNFDIRDYSYINDPPLFYFLLSFWSHLGNSEFILRLLPFIFGVLSIIAIYFLGKELFDEKVGLISAFIIAISPFHIYYSQELRSYSLVTFLALMTIFYLFRSLKENKISSWAFFILFTILTLYSHNISLFLIITVNCYFFLSYKRHKALLPRWLVSQFIIFVFYLPWVKVIFEQISHIKTSGLFHLQGIPIDPLLNFTRTFMIFNLSYNATEIMYFFIILILLPLFLFGIWNENKKERLYLLLFWLFIPIIMAMLFSILIFPIYKVRVVIYASIAYYIIIAYALSKLKPNKAYLYFLLLFSILSTVSLRNYYRNVFPLTKFPYYLIGHPRKEIKLVSDNINQNYRNGDVIIFPFDGVYLPFLCYHNNRLKERLCAISSKNSFAFKIYLVYIRLFKKLRLIPVAPEEIERNSYKRIWLVWENQETDQALKHIKEYLDKQYVMGYRKEFVDVTVYLYRIK